MTTTLTGLQQALWLGRNSAFELGGVNGRRTLEVEFDSLDIPRFASAWHSLVARHPALRMEIGGDCSYKILEAASAQELSADADDLAVSPDDMAQVRVLSADGKTRVLISFDMVATDADGVEILGADMRRLYEGRSLPALPMVTLRELLTQAGQQGNAEAREHWLGRIADMPAAPQLPTAVEPGKLKDSAFLRVERRLPKELWLRLLKIGEEAEASALDTLATTFGDVLGNWAKESRFTVAMMQSRRPDLPDGNHAVGNFATLIPLALDGSASRTFSDRLRTTRQELADIDSHGPIDGIDLIRELNRLGRRLAPSLPVLFMPRLADVAGGLQDWTLESGRIISDSTVLPQVALAHEVVTHDEDLTIIWHCRAELFPAGLVEQMADCHLDLLRALATDAARWESQGCEWLPQAQWDRREVNNSSSAELPDLRLHELFWDQAARTPDDPAVIAEDRTLTYRELRAAAGRLAEELREHGAKPNRMIAIVMEKGWEHPAAVMGILESGAAYVPIEPDLPEERFHYLLRHSEVKTAVIQPHLADTLPWPSGIELVTIDPNWLTGEGPQISSRVQGQRDLAYVIYTSGSTGLPKGVMIDHRGALNTVLDINRKFQIGPADRTIALTPLSFDLSVYDLFGLFAVGGAMVMPSAGTARAPWHWAELVEKHNVTVWNTVPALMEMLVGYALGRRERIADSLRLVVMSGDWIAVSLPDRIRALASPTIEVASLGGATEASIWSVYYRIGAVEPSWASIPYGRPLANQSIEVLDDALRRRPDWVPGEQFVGGFGVAMGYWRDEEKTRRAFIKHPRTGERLYRTGDLGRYFPDGEVEFLGREDFQVKVHGYRIELGEIEATLVAHELVTSSVVIAVGSARGEKRLVAYVTVGDSAVDQEAVIESISEHLAAKLPSHMIPAHLMVLDLLPLTRNGKVDRKALPMPQMGKRSKSVSGEQVVNDLEARLLSIWQEVLGPDLDLSSDPLLAGAHSLDAARVHQRVSAEIAPDLQLNDLLRATSIRALAKRVSELC